MPLWGFQRESTQPATGANTLAGRAKGFQAPFVAGDSQEMVEKRNIIATAKGWVYRVIRNRGTANQRIIDQTIVAGNPAIQNVDYTSNTFLGNPDVAQIYVRLNANGFISANASGANLYVVFNTPISFRASGNLCSITIANTVSGNAAVAYFSNTSSGSIDNANNTLVFRMPRLQSKGSNAATYKIQSQSISVAGGGNPLYNPEDGVWASANLVITGAVSNNLMNTIGNRITTFQVKSRANQ